MGREIARRLPGSSSKLSLQRCNLFFLPPPLSFSLSRRRLMSDLKLLSSFFPLSLRWSAKCHVVVLGRVGCVMWRDF